MMNADLGEAMVHGPLLLGRCPFHLLLDLVEQCIEVEALGVLDHSFSCQAPACATDEVATVFQYVDYLPNGRPWVAGQSTIKDTPYLFAGGWKQAQKKHFDDGGEFDKIYQTK